MAEKDSKRVYTRRYKQTIDDAPAPEIATRQKILEDSSNTGAIAKARSSNPFNTKNTPAGTGELLPEPVLYDKDGKINPKYDTSIGGDMVAGAGVGVASVDRSNPFQVLGGALGGAIGGAFNKNLKGKKQHEYDVKQTREQNEIIIRQTQAQERAEAMRLQREAKQKQLEIAQAREARMQAIADAKTEDKKKEAVYKNISTAYQMGDTEEVKKYQTVLASLQGYTGEIPDDYGVNWNPEPKKIGNFMYYVDKNNANNTKMAMDSNGNAISSLTVNDWFRVKKELTKDKFDETIETEAYNRAVTLITKLEKESKDGLKYRTPTGKMDYSKRNSDIMKMADQISTDMYAGKAGDIVYIDGTPVKMDISLQAPPPLAKPEDNSNPFNPSVSQQEAVKPQEYDATQPPMAKDVLPKYQAPQLKEEQVTVFNSFVEGLGTMDENKKADFDEVWKNVSEGGTIVTYKTINGKRRKIVIQKQNGKAVPVDVQ